MTKYQDVLKCYDDEAKPFVWLLTFHSSDGKQVKKAMGTTKKGLELSLKEARHSKVYIPKLKVASFPTWIEVENLDK